MHHWYTEGQLSKLGGTSTCVCKWKTTAKQKYCCFACEGGCNSKDIERATNPTAKLSFFIETLSVNNVDTRVCPFSPFPFLPDSESAFQVDASCSTSRETDRFVSLSVLHKMKSVYFLSCVSERSALPPLSQSQGKP